MAAQASQILDALATALAAVAGLSAAKVVRGVPQTTDKGASYATVTPPAVYLWLDPPYTATRGPTSRTHTVALRVGFAVFAVATSTAKGALENAALDLASLVSVAVLGAPGVGGLALDCDLEITTNGALPADAPGSVPGCFVAGAFLIRYQVVGGAL